MKKLFMALVATAMFGGHASAQSLLFENVTLIDGTGRAPVENASVLVEGERIALISRHAIDAPKAKRINGQGKYLIPGLMDVHIHLRGGRAFTPEGERKAKIDYNEGTGALQSFLRSGVTTVYDAGNNPEFIFELRRRERAGEIIAPRLLATGGVVTYPGSHGGGPGAALITGWPDAIPALDAHIALKPDILKLTYEERGWGARPLIPLLPQDLMEKVIAYYNDHGIRTTVHVSGENRARQAIAAGVDTLAHPVIVGPITDEFAKTMAAKQIPMATTLTIGENYSRLAEHPEHLDQPLYQASLSKAEIDYLKTTVQAQYDARIWTWWMKIMTPVAQENLRKIHEAGGVLALATDQSIGPATHREMELLVDAGISPLDVIKIGTLGAAKLLGMDDELGSIEEGKIADLVLLDGDPSKDINNAKLIDSVYRSGKAIDFNKLMLPIPSQKK